MKKIGIIGCGKRFTNVYSHILTQLNYETYVWNRTSEKSYEVCKTNNNFNYIKDLAQFKELNLDLILCFVPANSNFDLINQNFNDYEIFNSMPTHYFADNYAMPGFTGGNTSTVLNLSITNWPQLLDFGGESNALFPDDHEFVSTPGSGDVIGGFFIDKAWYAGIQPGGGTSNANVNSSSHVLGSVRNLIQAWRDETFVAIGSPFSQLNPSVNIFPTAQDWEGFFTSISDKLIFYDFIYNEWFVKTRESLNNQPGTIVTLNIPPEFQAITWFNPDTGQQDSLPATIDYVRNPAFGNGIYT